MHNGPSPWAWSWTWKPFYSDTYFAFGRGFQWFGYSAPYVARVQYGKKRGTYG